MITTVTMNPSIDKLYTLDRFDLYEVMRVKQVSNTPGGKGLNVARVAALAGEPVTALGLIGGYNGQYLVSLLENTGIRARFTPVAAETRSCINAWDLSCGRSTEYLEPGAPVSQAEAARFLADFRAALADSDVITISGSLPEGLPGDWYGQLIALARGAGKPVLLDTSGETLRQGVLSRPTLIKPNTDEIAQLLGRQVESRQELVVAAKELQAQGIAYVVVSLGEEGALMACPEGVYSGRPPKITPVNTVGCGDSMVAGFAVGLARGLAPADMLRLAVAVSAANALTLATGHFLQEDFQRLLPQVDIARL